MPFLTQSIKHIGQADFYPILKKELLALDDKHFPLHLAATDGGYIKKNSKDIIILGSEQDKEYIRIRLTLFVSEIITGCSCGDEPFSQNAHCELTLLLNKKNGAFSFSAGHTNTGFTC